MGYTRPCSGTAAEEAEETKPRGSFSPTPLRSASDSDRKRPFGERSSFGGERFHERPPMCPGGSVKRTPLRQESADQQQ